MASIFSEEEFKAALEKAADTPKMKQIVNDLLLKINAGATPEEAIGLTPELQEALYNYAYTLFNSGKYQTALSQFIFLRQINPLEYKYNFAIAACYQYLEQYPEAAGNYVLCDSIDPLNPIHSMHLFHCFKKMDQPMSALFAINQAIEAVERNSQYEDMKEKILMEYKEFKKEVKKYMVDHWGNEEDKKRLKEFL
jgi:type III secretion system low calcium response chaperone LcrH/SycD